jgi:predicted enzyme related to lactoylglutathione lyase
MSDHKPGKFVWFEHVSRDARRAQAFYDEVLGWRTVPFTMPSYTYDMIYVGDQMIGGYASPRHDAPPHWISYVSVPSVDDAVSAAQAHGGRIIEAAYDTPTVGRRARLADPQGAELSVFTSATGDPPDEPGPPGTFCWNELHTPDPTASVPFYAAVAGFDHRAVEMGGYTYHLFSRAGTDRAGASSHIPPGVAPHWLPYVHVADADATASRATSHGGTVIMPPADIPGVGRIGALLDPTGATLAFMKPFPQTP